MCIRDSAVTINAAFTFRIVNPLMLREKWGEDYYGANVAMIVRGAIEEKYSKSSWDEIVEMPHEAIIRPVMDELENSGVELTYFCMEDRSTTKNIRHYGVNISQLQQG